MEYRHEFHFQGAQSRCCSLAGTFASLRRSNSSASHWNHSESDGLPCSTRSWVSQGLSLRHTTTVMPPEPAQLQDGKSGPTDDRDGGDDWGTLHVRECLEM